VVSVGDGVVAQGGRSPRKARYLCWSEERAGRRSFLGCSGGEDLFEQLCVNAVLGDERDRGFGRGRVGAIGP
jgi:hypothetical protein